MFNHHSLMRGEEQNREEGEIGSERREKGDLPPCSSPLPILGDPWGSFRGRQEEKWGSFQGRYGDHFRVGDHFGVGIISGAVQISTCSWTEKNSTGISKRSQQNEYIACWRILSSKRFQRLRYRSLQNFIAMFIRWENFIMHDINVITNAIQR